ncbi:Fc.00g049480.m01.CDS01 [Cosmosporella sp. VM-42]
MGIAQEGLTLLDGNVEGEMMVDYVFLHGLNGHPRKTWSYEPSDSAGFFWPAQILVDIPGCRVMTFGYNAAFERALVDNTTTINAIAQTFVNRLIDSRTGKDMNRPLVLIAHSLGGLVIKRALSNIHADRHTGLQTRKIKEQNAIYDSIAGIVFMGTPHAGSSVADAVRVKVLKSIAGATFKKAPENLIKALSAHSNELQDLCTSFERTTLFTQHVIEICTYYETKSTRFAGEEVVPRSMALLHYLNEREEGIPKPHTSMAKFSGIEDGTYQSVRQRLLDMGTDGLNTLRARQATYRISQIPGDVSREQLPHFLSTSETGQGNGPLGPVQNFRIHSYASRAGQKDPTKMATVTFLDVPPMFLCVKTEWTVSFVHNNAPGRILIDTNFDGFTVLNEVKEENHVLDCVALPGLGYHPFEVWQYDPTADPYMWLRDSLPQAAEGTQILLYGYDADYRVRECPLSVKRIAATVISHLRDIGRSSPSAKPLVVLAHSLGGIVLKQCLVELANSGSVETFMLQAIKTCIFIAVPTMLPSPLKLRAMAGNEQFDNMLHNLHEDENIGYVSTLAGMRLIPDVNHSEALLQEHESVQGGTSTADTFSIGKAHGDVLKLRPATQTVQTVARFLREASKAVNISELMHDKVGGGLMNWLFSPMWTGFTSYLQHASASQGSLSPSAELSSKEAITSSYIYQQFMSTLVLHSQSREESIESAYQDTFGWVWSNQDSSILSWLVSDHPLFWISGRPGSGKSTLMRYLWNHQQLSNVLAKGSTKIPRIKSAFFFHHRGTYEQKSFEGMLHSILFRILGEEPRLINILLPDFERLPPDQRVHRTWTLPMLMKAYNDILSQDLLKVEIFLFLDALDEYDGPSQAIVDFIRSSVANSAKASTRLKICFSSREWSAFVESFSDGPGFKIHEHTDLDVRNYISSRLSKDLSLARRPNSADFRIDEIRQLESVLAARANGVFIWVRAVIDEVSRDFSRGVPTKDLIKHAEDLPDDLDLLYTDSISRIPQRYRMESYILFETILRWEASTIPIDSLQSIMACAKCQTVSGCISAMQHCQKDATSSRIWFQDRGAGLIEITAEDRDGSLVLVAGFMHQTVLDFILKPASRALLLDNDFFLPVENGYSFTAKWALATAEMPVQKQRLERA